MIITIVVLFVLLIIVLILLVGVLLYISDIKQQLIEIDKEQHIQNKELLDLIKYKNESTTILLQHIEILKYLIGKDPILKKSKWEA